MALPRRNNYDGRMPNGPGRATNLSPKFNNGMAAGRRNPGQPGWAERGFESQDAARSVQRQYGLVKGADGGWVKPDMDFFARQMESQGWGPNAQAGALSGAGTPVGIGGARWMIGKNGFDFTGQASDVPFGNRPVGNAYNATQQIPYGQPQKAGGGIPVTDGRGGGGGQAQLDPREWNRQGFQAGPPRRNPGPIGGAGQGKGGGGIPVTDGRGQGPGPAGNKGPGRAQPGQGTPARLGQYSNFPAPQQPAANFLPMTPQFEAGRRGLDDEYMAGMNQIQNQQNMINPLYQQQLARMATDEAFGKEALMEGAANRGILSGGANPTGASQYLWNRDIQVPYGRERSDLATAASGAYGQSAEAMSGLGLQYNQGLAELLLNRAADAAANIPMNVPQFSTGGRNLRGQQYNNRPRKGGQNRRNRRGPKKK